jgi:hypothetical protein
VIGSGFQAQSQTEAIQCVRNLTDVRVRSRSKEKREAFAGANQGRAVDTAEEAVRGADIVVTCTPSKDPVIDDSWNTRGDRGCTSMPGVQSRPAPRTAMAADSPRGSGGGRFHRGREDRSRRFNSGSCRPERPPHCRPGEDRAAPPGAAITVFKSCGLGVEDVAAAAYVYERL